MLDDHAVVPSDRVRLASLLSGLVADHGGVDLDVERSGEVSEPPDLRCERSERRDA